MDDFKSCLKRCRLQAGLTQKEAAARLGIAYSTYRRYEWGSTEPTVSEAKAIAVFYGVTLDYLSGDSTVPRKID